jgi:hypothetical protein
MKPIKTTISIIKSNFRLTKNLKKTLVLDFLFYLSITILFYLAIFITTPFISKLTDSVHNTNIYNSSSVSATNSIMTTSAFILAFIFIIFIFLALLSFTYFKGKIWSFLLNKHLSKLNYANLFILLLLIFIPQLLFLVIITFITNTNIPFFVISFFLFTIIFIYFNNLIIINFITRKNIFLSIINGIKQGFTKFSKLILVCIFSLFTFILLNLVFGLFSSNNLYFIQYISPFILIIWAVWSRILFLDAYKS